MVELASDQVVAGRYRVLRLIGRGGMGAVYLVQHLETDEQLALKILHHGCSLCNSYSCNLRFSPFITRHRTTSINTNMYYSWLKSFFEHLAKNTLISIA